MTSESRVVRGYSLNRGNLFSSWINHLGRQSRMRPKPTIISHQPTTSLNLRKRKSIWNFFVKRIVAGDSVLQIFFFEWEDLQDEARKRALLLISSNGIIGGKRTIEYMNNFTRNSIIWNSNCLWRTRLLLLWPRLCLKSDESAPSPRAMPRVRCVTPSGLAEPIRERNHPASEISVSSLFCYTLYILNMTAARSCEMLFTLLRAPLYTCVQWWL